jgi:hypothetical protein
MTMIEEGPSAGGAKPIVDLRGVSSMNASTADWSPRSTGVD